MLWVVGADHEGGARLPVAACQAGREYLAEERFQVDVEKAAGGAVGAGGDADPKAIA
jgi:hypothetical protein